MADFKYFTRDEFTCKETGENRMKDSYIRWLDGIREECDFPFTVNSGFRGATHSAERNKPNGPGEHNRGECCDIAVSDGVQRMRLVAVALKHGATGIGVAKTFVHLDRRGGQPVMWTY